MVFDIKWTVEKFSLIGFSLSNEAFVRLFADDASMLLSGSSFDECIKSCKNGIAALIEWCHFNRLYINWTKTYIMFITNKRVVSPSDNSFNRENIEVVSKFLIVIFWFRRIESHQTIQQNKICLIPNNQ